MRLSNLSITVLFSLLLAAIPLYAAEQSSDIADAMETGDFSRVQELIRTSNRWSYSLALGIPVE
jgi:hypothetical protein